MGMLQRLWQKFAPTIVRNFRSRAVKKIKRTIAPSRAYSFNSDGFSTTHFLGFRSDHKFNESFATAIKSLPKEGLFNSEYAKGLEWRAHICAWAANQAIKLRGDFVECGVWHGLLSKTICEYLDLQDLLDRKFYLIDSWGAMPGSHSAQHYQPNIFEDVRSRFSMYPSVQLVQGIIPECLTQITSSEIAYLAIDMNSSEPELKTLEYFYAKIVKGGIIYFDDYGWEYPALRKVVDSFFSNKPETLLHFPSGNSIVVKL